MKTLITSFALLSLVLGFGGPIWATSFAEGASFAGEVSLPLKDYLVLLTQAEAADKVKEAEQEEVFSELVGQETRIRIEGDLAELVTVFQVEVTGPMETPVPLPFAGLAASATVEPAGASLHWNEGGGQNLCLAASKAGRFRVEVRGSRSLQESPQGLSLILPPSSAAVVSLELELPADLAWALDGAVVVREEAAEAGVRRVSFAPARGVPHQLRLSRKVEGAEAESTLARAAVVTLVELSETGARRHDLIHYEVLRGELNRFVVQLPEGLEVERVGTDEGEVLPLQEASGIVVPRETRLTAGGYLYLTSAETRGDLSLDPVLPAVEVRSRYLVTLASAAIGATPLPQGGWRQVDLDDLPPAFAETIRFAKPSAAWRRVDDGGEGEGGTPRLALVALPAAEKSEALVAKRETFTLLTVDGTLVHRETLDLRHGGSALEVELPPGAVLWSASVDGLSVRPVERGGRLAVPLSFTNQGAAFVEVVAVQERAIPKGRSELAMDLLRLDLPVLEHRWNLLLPEGNRYRYASGALRPTDAPPQESRFSYELEPLGSGLQGISGIRGKVVLEDGSPLPGAVVEAEAPELEGKRSAISGTDGRFWIRDLPAGRYKVLVSLDGFNGAERTIRLASGRTALVDVQLSLATVAEEIMVMAESPPGVSTSRLESKELEKHNDAMARGLYNQQVSILQQGLVGGVKPLAVEIPETGKGIFLSGVLPPRVVSLELDVRAGR